MCCWCFRKCTSLVYLTVFKNKVAELDVASLGWTSAWWELCHFTPEQTCSPKSKAPREATIFVELAQDTFQVVVEMASNAFVRFPQIGPQQWQDGRVPGTQNPKKYQIQHGKLPILHCAARLSSATAFITGAVCRRRLKWTAVKVGWHVGCSAESTMDKALEEAVMEWRQGYETPELIHRSRRAHASLPADPKTMTSIEETTESVEGNNVAFGLVFLPCKWAAKTSELLTEIRKKVKWPDEAPLLGVPTRGETLCLTSAEQDPSKPAAKAALLDETALGTISQESIRIQDTIDANPLLSIQAWLISWLWQIMKACCKIDISLPPRILWSWDLPLNFMDQQNPNKGPYNRFRSTLRLFVNGTVQFFVQVLRAKTYSKFLKQGSEMIMMIAGTQKWLAATSFQKIPKNSENSEVYGGKVNGSILAGRNHLGRESVDVASALIFGDVGHVGVTRRAVALLDACYPFAQKAGLLTDEPISLGGWIE